MKEEQRDLFSKEVLASADAICITTNGYVRKDGRAVMGRGVAKTAADMFPTIPLYLGKAITNKGNHLQKIYKIDNVDILSFPVKHNWWEKADLALIERSTYQLKYLTDRLHYREIYLPRPGCSNGKRDWETEVKPILEKYLDDRFTVVYL